MNKIMDWFAYTDEGNGACFLLMVAGVSGLIWVATRPGRRS
jgi:hypothetical protein